MSDNLYLNLEYNPDEKDPNLTSQALINMSLTSPLLSKASDFYLSVTRFRIPTEAIRIFTFQIDDTQNIPDVSIYEIGINNLGTLNTQKVKFVPQIFGIPAIPNYSDYTIWPRPSLTAPYFSQRQLFSGLYGVYDFQSMLDYVNTAIKASMIALGLGAIPSPYYIYDNTVEMISIIVDAAFIAANLEIYMNSHLINFFESFTFKVNTNPTTYHDEFYHRLNPIPYLAVSPYRFEEEYSSMQLWFDTTKFIISSQSLPTRPEQAPLQNSGVSNSVSILQDYEVTFDNVKTSNGIAIYNPSGPLRLVDLISDQPITAIDLIFSYMDKYGHIYPIYITRNQSIAIKLGFFRKSLYNNDFTPK